jgi:hypothetical protein
VTCAAFATGQRKSSFTGVQMTADPLSGEAGFRELPADSPPPRLSSHRADVSNDDAGRVKK